MAQVHPGEQVPGFSPGAQQHIDAINANNAKICKQLALKRVRIDQLTEEQKAADEAQDYKLAKKLNEEVELAKKSFKALKPEVEKLQSSSVSNRGALEAFMSRVEMNEEAMATKALMLEMIFLFKLISFHGYAELCARHAEKFEQGKAYKKGCNIKLFKYKDGAPELDENGELIEVMNPDSLPDNKLYKLVVENGLMPEPTLLMGVSRDIESFIEDIWGNLANKQGSNQHQLDQKAVMAQAARPPAPAPRVATT